MLGDNKFSALVFDKQHHSAAPWVCLFLTSAIVCLWALLLLSFTSMCHPSVTQLHSYVVTVWVFNLQFSFFDYLNFYPRKLEVSMLGHDIQGTLCKHQCPHHICIFNVDDGIMHILLEWWWYLDCSLHKENTCFVLVNKFLENTLKLPPSEYVQESHVYIRLWHA